MSVCRSCGAPIFWGITETNRRMPLDPAPVPDGNILRLEGDDIRVLGKAELADWDLGDLYISHFTTCPNAVQHRRRRGD